MPHPAAVTWTLLTLLACDCRQSPGPGVRRPVAHPRYSVVAANTTDTLSAILTPLSAPRGFHVPVHEQIGPVHPKPPLVPVRVSVRLCGRWACPTQHHLYRPPIWRRHHGPLPCACPWVGVDSSACTYGNHQVSIPSCRPAAHPDPTAVAEFPTAAVGYLAALAPGETAPLALPTWLTIHRHAPHIPRPTRRGWKVGLPNMHLPHLPGTSASDAHAPGCGVPWWAPCGRHL